MRAHNHAADDNDDDRPEDVDVEPLDHQGEEDDGPGYQPHEPVDGGQRHVQAYDRCRHDRQLPQALRPRRQRKIGQLLRNRNDHQEHDPLKDCLSQKAYDIFHRLSPDAAGRPIPLGWSG